MQKKFRKGILGALMDEYENVLDEFAGFIDTIPPSDYTRIVDPHTKDDDCRSVQSIASHVINSGYNYADYFRSIYNIQSQRPLRKEIDHKIYSQELQKMFDYTLTSLDGKWSLTADDIVAHVFKVRWGVDYNIEQLFEHAIVHVLRHKRQINKLIHKGQISQIV